MEYTLNDSAISSKGEDIFNFSYYAEKVNTIIQNNTKNSECIVIGVHGKWGEGKTSFMNLIKERLADFIDNEGNRRILKYEFNPWRYSTEDEMLFDFFDGLSKKLLLDNKDNFKIAGKYIRKFSRYMKAIKLSASIGTMSNNAKITFEPHRILETLGEDLEGEKPTLDDIKEKIDTELGKTNYKIAVYIDDIDRLDKDEIYTLLKIIKLNANFKNLIYIITLDPEQVAKAIHHRYGTDKEDGKLFLEKIINIPITLPKIENEDLQLFFEEKLKHIKSLLNYRNKEEEYKSILYTFNTLEFKTPREIIRVLNSFFIGAFAIGEEVDLRDLFLIEYIKVTNEECHRAIKTYEPNSLEKMFDESGPIKEVIDFDKAFTNSDEKSFKDILVQKFNIKKRLLDSLFPNTEIGGYIDEDYNYVTHLRINTREHFDKYFSYHTKGKISEKNINELKLRTNEKDAKSVIAILESLLDEPADKLHKVIYRLDSLIEEYKNSDDRYFLYQVLLENIDIIPDSKKDIFGLTEKTMLIEKIAVILNEDKEVSNDNIIEIAKTLDYKNLCHFTRKFNFKSELREDLNKLILEKVEQETNHQSPFYLNPLNLTNKMVMRIWNELDNKGFMSHIKKSLNKSTIKLLIRNFPGIYNGDNIDEFNAETYDFMKSIIDPDFVKEKLIEYYPELAGSEYNYNSISNSPSFGGNSEEDTILQFLYWYKKDKEQQ